MLKMLAILFCTLCIHPLLAQPATDEPPTETPQTVITFNQLTQLLAQSSLGEKADILQQMASLYPQQAAPLLSALQQGQLFANSQGDIALRQNDQSLQNPHNQHPISEALAPEFKKIQINNSLRTTLAGLLAQLQLASPQPNMRLEAVKRFLSEGLTASTAELLAAQQKAETYPPVKEAITLTLNIYSLTNSSEASQFEALKALRSEVAPEAKTALLAFIENAPSAALKTEAEFTLHTINNSLKYNAWAENLFFGLSLGSVLLLSAIGLSITFGVMGVINMAHGEMMMIGAYTTWVIQQLFPQYLNYSLFMAIPTAFIVAAFVGICIERGVIQFLYGRPLETLLATFGISLILQQAARSLFSPLNRAVSLPDWMSGSLVLNPVLSLTYNRLAILVFTLLVFLILLFIIKKTSLGLKVRAVSQNRTMAKAVGVKANWVDALTFGLGSGIAGIAGVALSQITNVGPNLGQAYIIDSFMVVVFGGVGNLWGTLVGAMGLGIINKFLEPYAGAVLAKVLVLVLLILFIQKKPKGLFPPKGRAAAD